MHIEARLFEFLTAFFALCAVVYGTLTAIYANGGIEWAGTTALVLTTGLALITGKSPYRDKFPSGADRSLSAVGVMVADHVRRVPPVAGSAMSRWPAWRAARRRMLVSPLERVGVPMQ